MNRHSAYGDGDGYITCDQGHMHWGVHGGAGALLRHVDDQGQQRYLLGLRSRAVDHGGVWGIPGGAIDSHETPEQGALREAQEEFGALPQMSNVQHLHTNDHGGWAYHTISADVDHPWNPELSPDNWETEDTRWCTPEEIDQLPLHPGFQQTWNNLRPTAFSKAASIIDPIHDCLPDSVWEFPCNTEPHLHPAHREFLMHLFVSLLEQNGYSNAHEWLTLALSGSLCTYQYSDESDVDVNLWIQTHSGNINPPIRAEIVAICTENVDGISLPGTPYALQCFVIPPGVPMEKKYKRGLRAGYNINDDHWIIPPDRLLSHNIEKDMHNAYISGLQICDKMALLLDHEPQAAIRLWHRIHAKRRRAAEKVGLGDMSYENIIFKMLVQRGLAQKAANLAGERFV